MAIEMTLSIIKPDAVARDLIGAIAGRFEQNGLKILAMRMLKMTKEQAGEFYAVHKEQSFYNDLIEYMSSGPVVVQLLSGENAIVKNRELMGVTNPENAAPGTIRADFAKSMRENSVHGSDAPETAKNEIAFFFNVDDICER